MRQVVGLDPVLVHQLAAGGRQARRRAPPGCASCAIAPSAAGAPIPGRETVVLPARPRSRRRAGDRRIVRIEQAFQHRQHGVAGQLAFGHRRRAARCGPRASAKPAAAGCRRRRRTSRGRGCRSGRRRAARGRCRTRGDPRHRRSRGLRPTIRRRRASVRSRAAGATARCRAPARRCRCSPRCREAGCGRSRAGRTGRCGTRPGRRSGAASASNRWRGRRGAPLPAALGDCRIARSRSSARRRCPSARGRMARAAGTGVAVVRPGRRPSHPRGARFCRRHGHDSC